MNRKRHVGTHTEQILINSVRSRYLPSCPDRKQWQQLLVRWWYGARSCQRWCRHLWLPVSGSRWSMLVPLPQRSWQSEKVITINYQSMHPDFKFKRSSKEYKTTSCAVRLILDYLLLKSLLTHTTKQTWLNTFPKKASAVSFILTRTIEEISSGKNVFVSPL